MPETGSSADENVFKRQGLRRLSADTGMYLVTPEDEVVIASEGITMLTSPWLADAKK